MKTGATTIYDIAKELGISASTVSRALRNHPDISKPVAERIKLTAKKLNYRPNTIAQSLKERKTKVIGVLIPEISNHYYLSIINGMEDVAFRKGYHILVARSNESYSREVLQLESLSAQVDGVVACISQETTKFDHFKKAKQYNIPLVFFDRVAEKISGSKVAMNDEAIIYSLTEHLIKSGYQNISLLTGPKRLSTSKNQMKGYRAAIAHYDLKKDESLILNEGYSFQEGSLAFQKAMRGDLQPDAFVVANDQIALAVYLELKKLNLVLGNQVGLASAGSEPLLGLLEPSITCTQSKGFELGSLAIQMCIQEIENKESVTKLRNEIISSEINIRKSSIRGQNDLVVSAYSKYLNEKSISEPIVYIY